MLKGNCATQQGQAGQYCDAVQLAPLGPSSQVPPEEQRLVSTTRA